MPYDDDIRIGNNPWGFIELRDDGRATIVANAALLRAISSWVAAAQGDSKHVVEIQTALIVVPSRDVQGLGLMDDATTVMEIREVG